MANGLNDIAIYIWDHNKERALEWAETILDDQTMPMVAGVAFHWYSGDHFEALRMIRERFPEKDIWCYSGYLFENLAAGQVGAHSRTLLGLLDVLVDGPFILEQKELSLRFRGSANQRLIDVPASLKAGKVLIWDKLE